VTMARIKHLVTYVLMGAAWGSKIIQCKNE
jgi:hypothetical protein